MFVEDGQETGVTEEAGATPTPTDENSSEETVDNATETDKEVVGQKTYTEQELNERTQAILHERTKSLAEELNMYRSLGTPSQLYDKIRSQSQQPKETPKEESVELSNEDKEFLEYMNKKVPGWKKMQEMASNWEKMQSNLQYVESMKTSQDMRLQQFTRESVDAFDGICNKYGITNKDQKAAIEETVANLVKSSPALISKYQRGDLTYVDDAFKNVANMLGLKEKTPVTELDSRKKIAALPKSMPKGGISTHTSKERKMTDDERTDAAFNALKSSGA